MSQYIRKNTIPYDFTADSARAVYGADLDSVSTASAGGETIAFALNTNNNSLSVCHNGITSSFSQAYQYYYDATVDSKAVGNVVLRGAPLPKNFVVTNAIWAVTTAFTSGGAAQISLGTSAAAVADLVAAAVLGTNGTLGRKQGIPDWATIADWKNVTVSSSPVLAISVAALTAGAGILTLFGYNETPDAIV